jgi:hypothetical protein
MARPRLELGTPRFSVVSELLLRPDDLQGLSSVSASSGGIRVFPHFAVVCGVKRPTAGSVGLFVAPDYPDAAVVVAVIALVAAILTLRLAAADGLSVEHFHGRQPGRRRRLLRNNGAGEMLVWLGADLEDFRQPRLDLADRMENELDAVIHFFVERPPVATHGGYQHRR